jgi:hypothetical protein
MTLPHGICVQAAHLAVHPGRLVILPKEFVSWPVNEFFGRNLLWEKRLGAFVYGRADTPASVNENAARFHNHLSNKQIIHLRPSRAGKETVRIGTVLALT